MSWTEVIWAVGLGLLVNEFCDCSGWAARRLVAWSARLRYRDSERAQVRSEELVALVNDQPSSTLKLLTGLNFAFAALLDTVPAKLREKTRSLRDALTTRRVRSVDGYFSYTHEDTHMVRQLDRDMRGLLRRPLRRTGFQLARDDTALTPGMDLEHRVQGAMRASNWLLLVLSEASSRSPWVDREIEYWCEELGRADRLLIIRGDEEVDLSWDRQSASFSSMHSLPLALVRAVSAEPLWIDATGGHWSDGVAVHVAAALLGRSPEDVRGEDLFLARKRRRLAAGALAGLVALAVTSITAAGLAVSMQQRMREAETDARASAASELHGSDLSGASLAGADLRNADLSGSNLSGASLVNADLSGADLTDAILTGADLSNADLSGATLTGVVVDATTVWPNNFQPPRRD